VASPHRTVDVHAHGVPDLLLDELARDPERWGVRVADLKVRPGLLDLEDRVAAMDRTGVDVQLLSPWMDLAASSLPADLAPGTVGDFARLSNDAMADLVRRRPDRLLALANLPLQEPEAAAAELRRAVGDLGMVGAEIATRPAGRELDDQGFDVVWRTVAELDCLVLVHPHRSLAGRGVTRHFLGNLVGNPAETTIAIGHLVFGGVAERHPDVRFCFVHGGGFAPYQVGRWDHAFTHDARGAAALLTRRPSELLARMWFDTVVHDPTALSHLLTVVGAEQVVLGSDHPFEMGDLDPCVTVRSVPGIDDATVQRVLAGNALALLGSHAARV
jgi:aminocarboxymuconate-semialdehyde decarboxylase